MGRMHHHDKHAATKDGHRADDPHAVTNLWRQQQIDAMMAERHAGGIRREGHEVFDENVDYGQRVSAFGNVERNVSDEQGGGYDVQGDEMVDLTEGEEDQAFAKKAMLGQDMPPPPPVPPSASKPSEPTGPPLSEWEQNYASVRDKDDASKIQQWHSMQSGANKVSERLGIKAPKIPPPRVSGEKRSGPPAPHTLMPRSAPPEPPR